MILPTHLRAAPGGRRLGVWVLGCLLLASSGRAIAAQNTATPEVQAPPAPVVAAPAGASQSGSAAAAVAGVAQVIQTEPSKHQRRQAEDAYLSGAKKLEHDDLDGAETQFRQALKMDPSNRSYAIAISVTRQHRLTELVQQASRARQSGDQMKADTLLAEARTIDPLSPMVLEHTLPILADSASAPRLTPAAVNKSASASGGGNASVDSDEPWKIQAPVLASAIHLTPSDTAKSFNLRGTSADVLRDVALAFGIRAVVDDSVEKKDVRFDIENVTYQDAMNVLMSMTHTFAVPVDETSVLMAKDDPTHRQQLERQLEETIEVPGSTQEQLNELVNVIRNIFDVHQATVQAGQGSILLRAPEGVMGPLNQTMEGLLESTGEVMVEVKMYEINKTRTTNVGTALPSQFTAFNVDQAANSIVNSNQSLVQQAIAQGAITSTTSNLQIALALIQLGLVQSSLATNLIGVFGGGALQTGISASTNMTLNFGLNSSDTRALDDIQIRVGNNQEAVFREGTRYPIISSTYTTGVSTAASALSNASINGVPVASLLSQFAGGTSATIPQVTYEDLGITLNAKPGVQRSGRINLLLNLKIEALGATAANGMPILQNRQFASNLTLVDGESAVMVSNVSKNEVGAMTGLPGLGELPGFQVPTEENVERDSSQLVVIVTPHVVRKRTEQVAGPRIAVRNSPSNP